MGAHHFCLIGSKHNDRYNISLKFKRDAGIAMTEL